MTLLESVGAYLDGSTHPRLTAVSLGGVAFLIAGGLAWVGSPAGSATSTPLWFQLSVVGYALLLVGVSGYIAMAVFDRHPDQ